MLLAEGPMAQFFAHDQHTLGAGCVQELGGRVAPKVSTTRLMGQTRNLESMEGVPVKGWGNARRCDARQQSVSEAQVSRDTVVVENHAGVPPPVKRLLQVDGRRSGELEINSTDP